MGGGASKGKSKGKKDSVLSPIGVSAQYLQSFVSEHGPRLQGKTTADVVAEVIHPMTAEIGGCSMVDFLQKVQHKHASTGEAGWLVIHSHSDKFLSLCDSLLAFCAQQGIALESTFLWIDAFCLAQRQESNSLSASWLTTYSKFLAGIRQALVVWSPILQPAVLSRALCLFEIFIIRKSNGHLELVMSDEKSKQFWDTFKKNPGDCRKTVESFSFERNARTSVENDRVLICDFLRAKAGGATDEACAAEVDKILRFAFDDWAVDSLEKRIAAKEAAAGAGDDAAAASVVGWKSVLGRYYQILGETSKAKFLLERSLSMKVKLKDRKALDAKRANSAKKGTSKPGGGGGLMTKMLSFRSR